MANLFFNLVVPATNGVGAAVDVSAMGRRKTITLNYSTLGNAGAQVTVEFSCDGGTSFFPVAGFNTSGKRVVDVACDRLRVRVSNAGSTVTGNCDVGADDVGTQVASLVPPVGNGVGASVDVSALGTFNTVTVTGTFSGTVIVEVSQDGTDWSPCLLFNAPGAQSKKFTAQFMRVRRQSVTAIAGSPVVSVAAVNDSGAAGAGNTLDQAYDEGGPGAGREIFTTDGPVALTGDGIGTAQTEALAVANNTPASIQYSPLVSLLGHGVAGFGPTDREVRFGYQVQTINETLDLTDVVSGLTLLSELDGGGLVRRFAMRQNNPGAIWWLNDTPAADGVPQNSPFHILRGSIFDDGLGAPISTNFSTRVVGTQGNPATAELQFGAALGSAIPSASVMSLRNDGKLAPNFFAFGYPTFNAVQAVLPSVAPATLASRNDHAILAFDDTVSENALFESVIPPSYDGSSSLEVVVDWVAATAVAGDVKWDAQFERDQAGGHDIDADDFAAAQTATDTTAAGAAGIITRTVVTFTAAEADGLVGGDAFRLRLTRDPVVGGNMTGDAQVLRVAVQEA